MVRFPGGSYPIGADNGAADAAPAHLVTLKPFLMDQDEVTNAQFAAFLNGLGVTLAADASAGTITADVFPAAAATRFTEGSEGQEAPDLLIALDDEHSRIGAAGGRFVPESGFANHPVTETTWRGARDFCAWRGARLPMEVEWEAAARGRNGRTYPWGEAAPSPELAVFGRGSGETDPVGAHPAGATPDGVRDLAGNLQEWTSTLYLPYPYDPTDGREDPNDPGERVTRGGDHVYDSTPETLTAYHRTGFSRLPGRGHRHIGFRCARSLDAQG
jgi:iron(II)-dependent oxidoreductase